MASLASPRCWVPGVGWPRVELGSSRGSEASGSVNRGLLGCVCLCVCICGLLGLRLPFPGNVNLAIVLGVPPFSPASRPPTWRSRSDAREGVLVCTVGICFR